MALDVFALRDRIVDEYREYFESFIHILDPRIEAHVRRLLAEGELWPDAVLQLNPAYEAGPTLGALAAQGTITAETARYFSAGTRLYAHQQKAIDIAARGQSYVVSTGTGSGKSLTYLIPIFDRVLRTDPARHSVRAIIVYPMNALINSQLDALETLRRTHWPECPVRFARYTGQERDEQQRDAIRKDPPHVLLTNYVMLEYMLIRPWERSLVSQATRELSFLVMDELHVYRGRQGADVAMLLRRLRQRAGRPDLQCIGTSATLVTEGDRDAKRAAIAAVGSKLFGIPLPAENVVDETLQRVTEGVIPASADALRAAVQAPPPEPTPEGVARHPLAAWVEETFGLASENGRLVRRSPLAFRDGLGQLVEQTGMPLDLCRERLKAALAAGNAAQLPSGEPVFAFRLHQFLASGGSVYATLESAETRTLSAEGQYYAPAGPGHPGERLQFPLSFCRQCGQEYYLASRRHDDAGERLLPRSPLLNVTEDEGEGEPGFFAIERDGLWHEAEDLPDNWFEFRKSGPKLKARYAEHEPVRLWVRPDGRSVDAEGEGAIEGWWQPKPLMLCLRCHAAYDLRETGDFRKLVTLSQTGRSTATTILGSAAVVALRENPSVEAEARKLLSFTDNRQDAALQAGHLNDFVQVVLLRGALVRALEAEHELAFDRIGAAIFEAMALDPVMYMQDAVAAGPGFAEARRAMVDLLDYRAIEDLARAWRVAQPNLEQCGLLRVDYHGLPELATDDTLWRAAPIMAGAAPERRQHILRAVLDHLRGVLAVDAEALNEEQARRLVKRVNASLREPWAFDEFERLRRGTIALLAGVTPANRDQTVSLRLGARSAIGRYLRSRRTWDLDENLPVEAVEGLIETIIEALRGHILSVVDLRGEPYGVQIRVSALRWCPGDGRVPGPDPVRAKSLHLRRQDLIPTEPNAFFLRLYQEQANAMAGLLSAEHTGQVRGDDRIKRENAFREGKLSVLFCSPTMELGIDIKDLSIVHLRNVPPTPANYAQRSGRAGRGGKPALVLTFSSYGNAHDHYFFRHKTRMIAGAVAPPRIDLANKELVEAHLHSVWLSIIGPRLKSSIADVLDLDQAAFPLLADMAAEMETSALRLGEIIAAFREVASTLGSDVAGAPWFGDAWLEDTVRNAANAFDKAFDRWRELYQAAVAQRDAARRRIDSPRLSRKERDAAEQQEREAKREIELLLNRGGITESDFYTYRYIANEGFIPGYNFPRLPLRALVVKTDQAQSIDRPRFLGLSEFGPGNVVYHEGRKHRIVSCIVPAGGLEGRLARAKLCLSCGYVHPGEEAVVDLCVHCGTRLDGATSEFPQRLLDQPTVRAARWTRISSEEEERAREGYHVTTQFRLPPGTGTRRIRLAAAEGQATILAATYVPQAELWRINHGWRRSPERNGFVIDRSTGRWQGKDGVLDDEEGMETTASALLTGVKPFVKDSRNILLLRPAGEEGVNTPFLKTLAYALRRAIQITYQVEEQEIAAEIIGQEQNQRILLWEAAEGGIGIWERLIEDPRAFAELARCALSITHHDPETGAELPGWAERCTAACYDCLLSYSNQPDHRHINRELIRAYLHLLATAKVMQAVDARSYDEQYAWLCEQIDPASTFERAFLDLLHRDGRHLPDYAQHRPSSDIASQPDFYYERNGMPGVCVFVDGPHHDQPSQAEHDRHVREALRDQGYRVVVISHAVPLPDQIHGNADVFAAI